MIAGAANHPAEGRDLARERTSHSACLFRRRVARRLHARHQQGNPQARARLERAARHRRTARGARRPLSSTSATATIRNTTPKRSISSCCARSGAAWNCASSSTSSRVLRRAASTAPCSRARSAMICRWGRCATSGSTTPTSSILLSPDTRARRLEQVVPQAVPLGRREDRHAERDQGHGGPPEGLAVRALALVPAAARRARSWLASCTTPSPPWASPRGRPPRCCRPATRSTCS